MANKEIGIRLSLKDKELVERGLANLGKDGQAALRKISKSGDEASSGLSALNRGAGLARAAIGGLIGGIVAGGLTGIVTQVRQIAGGVAEIGDEARRAGVGVKVFQELKYVAEQNRIGVDSLTDGLKELSLRADEFILTGGGSAAEAFKRLGFDALDLKKKLEDPSKLFTEIIGKLGRLDKAAQIRIADEIFGGTGGERFVQLIEQGEGALRDTIQSANDLGIVMDDELIKKATELDRKFNTLAVATEVNLKSAIVAAAYEMSVFLELFDKTSQQSGETLDRRLRAIGIRGVEIENELLKANAERRLADSAPNAPVRIARIDERIASWRKELEVLKAEEAEIVSRRAKLEPIKLVADTPTPPPPDKPGNTKISQLAREAQRVAASLQTSSEAHAATMAKLNEMLSRGYLDQENYNRAVAEAVAVRAKATLVEGDFAEALAVVEDARRKGMIAEKDYAQIVEESALRRLEAENSASAGVVLGLKRFQSEATKIGEIFADATVQGVQAFEDKLVEAFSTGKADWGDLARTILTDLIRINTRTNITGPLSGFLSGLFGGGGGLPINLMAANGAAFDGGRVQAFADGGIVNNATLFRHRGGLGVMGEAGDEGILPLSRMANGKLGVSSSGASVVVQNIDQRSGGAPIETSVSRGAGGETVVRNIVRDEMGQLLRAGTRDRENEIVSVVSGARRSGRL